jgi:hypothetical protein
MAAEALHSMPGDPGVVQLVQVDLPPMLGSLAVSRLPPASLQQLIAGTLGGADLGHQLMQMFHVLQALDQHDFALDMQAKALTQRQLFRLAGPPDPAVRFLALMGPGDMQDNTPLEFVVADRSIRLDLLYLLPDQTFPNTVPDHDVLFVAVGESSRNQTLLDRIASWISSWPRPVLNHPAGIRRCARDVAYALLHDIPGLAMAPTWKRERDVLAGTPMPFTIRPIDTQGGTGLAKIKTAHGLAGYLSDHAQAQFYVSEFVDYASRDGLYRKARIALIDGKPYVCHLAISDSWMVHYQTAGMQHSERKRTEEEDFMASFDLSFGARHGNALRAVAARLGLDHVILDCAETRDGRLLVFEADSRGWIHATDQVDVYPYKIEVMRRAFDAFEAMVRQHIGFVRPVRCAQ